ncbi:MAG: arginine--tRNA ligase, partial [Deltaproteobacteria bacterium]
MGKGWFFHGFEAEMKEVIRELVREALSSATRRGMIALGDVESLPIEVTRSKEPKFGDYTTNAAMVMASRAGLKPRDLAAIITENVPDNRAVLEKSEIAGPGFINFFLAPRVWTDALHRIHEAGERYGHAEAAQQARILLEFVSANPTGPLHVGHGRGAAVGDTLARLLKARGFDLETEYYVNDAGNQMKILGKSLLLRYKELTGEKIEFPEDHYRGDYIVKLARELEGTSLAGELDRVNEEEAIQLAARFACDRILQGIKEDLELFGVSYDRFESEKTLHESGAVSRTIEELRGRGKVMEKEGALWFAM